MVAMGETAYRPVELGAARRVGARRRWRRPQGGDVAQIGPPLPAKDYRAELLLTPNAAGGTDLRWTGSFTEGLPGTGPVMLIFLRGVVRFLARRLVSAAERN
jgi:hypothetical protein